MSAEWGSFSLHRTDTGDFFEGVFFEGFSLFLHSSLVAVAAAVICDFAVQNARMAR